MGKTNTTHSQDSQLAKPKATEMNQLILSSCCSPLTVRNFLLEYEPQGDQLLYLCLLQYVHTLGV